MWTRGKEVKYSENFADVINGCSHSVHRALAQKERDQGVLLPDEKLLLLRGRSNFLGAERTRKTESKHDADRVSGALVDAEPQVP